MPRISRIPLWLDQIPEQIDTVSDTQACLAEIHESIHPEDHFVAFVEERWRKVLVRAFDLARQAATLNASIGRDTNIEDVKLLTRQSLLLDMEANTLKDAFYLWLYMRYWDDLFGKAQVALRDGWEIVWCDMLSKGSVLSVSMADQEPQEVFDEMLAAKTLMH